MNVLLINGSPHKNGCTNAALTEMAKVLNEAGVTYRSIYNYLISGTSLKRMDDFVGEEDAGHFEGISDG